MSYFVTICQNFLVQLHVSSLWNCVSNLLILRQIWLKYVNLNWMLLMWHSHISNATHAIQWNWKTSEMNGFSSRCQDMNASDQIKVESNETGLKAFHRKCDFIYQKEVLPSNSGKKCCFKAMMMIIREVLGVEIGARSLVEVLPVVKVKSD